jgi:hypothetical protein
MANERKILLGKPRAPANRSIVKPRAPPQPQPQPQPQFDELISSQEPPPPEDTWPSEDFLSLPISVFTTNHKLHFSALGSEQPADKTERVRSIPTAKLRAKIIERISVDDAVALLAELKLRGDYVDVLWNLSKGARLAVEAVGRGASKSGGMTAGILRVTSAVKMAGHAQKLATLDAAALLLEMERRGGSVGPVLEALERVPLVATLVSCSLSDRAKLVVVLSPEKQGHVKGSSQRRRINFDSFLSWIYIFRKGGGGGESLAFFERQSGVVK